MGVKVEESALLGATGAAKTPRTPRGQRTLRKILDAARDEFGERGFSDSSIVGITQRAGVALGTFYTYFDSKEAVFHALVRDMSRASRASNSSEVQKNADGSVDIYFGPTAPAGKESNWVPTKPGEQFAMKRRAFILIKNAFEEAGITIPFPTVHVKEGESHAGAAARVITAPESQPPAA